MSRKLNEEREQLEEHRKGRAPIATKQHTASNGIKIKDPRSQWNLPHPLLFNEPEKKYNVVYSNFPSMREHRVYSSGEPTLSRRHVHLSVSSNA